METKTYKLKDIAVSICDGVHNTVLDNENGDCFLLSAKNIKNGIISFDQTDRKIDKSTRDKLSKRTNLSKGDVLVTTVGTVGELAIVDENYQKYEFQRSVGIIKCNLEIVLPQYLYYLLKTESYNYYLHVVATGAAQPCIFLSTLKNIKVKLPNLRVQSDVISVLSNYDKLIQNYKKQIEDLQNLASELYKEWFVRFRFPGYEKATFENGIPVGWKVDRVKKIFSIFDTKRIPLSSMTRDNMKKIYPYYGAAELMDYVDDYLFDGVYLLMGEDGSVVTSEGKPILQYVWGKFWVNNHAHVLQGKDEFSTELLHLMFKQMDISGIVTGSAQPKISQGRLFKKKVIIPEQNIVKNFDSVIQPIYKKIRSLREQINNLDLQRSLLLPRLMSGKLEVK